MTRHLKKRLFQLEQKSAAFWIQRRADAVADMSTGIEDLRRSFAERIERANREARLPLQQQLQIAHKSLHALNQKQLSAGTVSDSSGGNDKSWIALKRRMTMAWIQHLESKLCGGEI